MKPYALILMFLSLQATRYTYGRVTPEEAAAYCEEDINCQPLVVNYVVPAALKDDLAYLHMAYQQSCRVFDQFVEKLKKQKEQITALSKQIDQQNKRIEELEVHSSWFKKLVRSQKK
jgi:hypothetical protein